MAGEGCKQPVRAVSRADVGLAGCPRDAHARLHPRPLGSGVGCCGPEPDAKDVEIAVLRHQLRVLRRRVVRPHYQPSDRLVLAVLSRLLPRERWSAFLVTPATLLRWHRELIRRRWTYPRRDERDARRLDPDSVALVVRLARENRRWG